VDSVRKQTYGNLEIVLIDDGSADGSGRICDDLAQADPRIKVVHQENLGVSAARNNAVDASAGEYVLFVDGDDTLLPDCVEHHVTLLERHSADISVSAGAYSTFDRRSKRCRHETVMSGPDAVKAILCYRLPIGPWAKLFRRSLLERHRLRFDPGLYNGEGFCFNIDCFLKSSKVVCSDQRVYFYRRDNLNSGTTVFRMANWESALRALKLIEGKLKGCPPEVMRAWRFASWRTHSDVYDYIALAKAKDKAPQLYRLSKKVTKGQAFSAFLAPVSAGQKIRALVMMVCPDLIVKMLEARRKKYGVGK
jgi:glycosyltransferase involved in cell wall biosynthesis